MGSDQAEVAASKVPSTMWQVLRRNPDLVKVMVASGLQRAAVTIAMVLGLQNLRVMVWKENTAQYTAMISMAMSALSMTTSGLFGRFGDRCGRRLAAIVYGLATFAPACMLMIFGFSSAGLLASSVATVLSGIAIASDALLVLASDVTLEEDRAMAFGLFQSFTSGLSFLLFGLPAIVTTMPFIHGVPNPSITAWLVYQLVLGVLYLAAVASVKAQPIVVQCEASKQAETESQEARTVPQPAHADPRCMLLAQKLLPMFSSFRMISRSKGLRCLYLTSFFLFFSGDVVFDLGGLYFREELDLLDNGSLEEQQTVSVLSTLPPQLFIIPATAVAGLLADRWGSMTLLKVLIPVSGIMTAGSVLLALVPRLWVVPIVCLFLNVASLAGSVPLKHLVSAAAPPGCMGEAMGTLGMVSQVISFLANAVVAATTPSMYALMEKPLWMVYVVCGALTMLGMLPLLGLADKDMKPAPEKDGGSVETLAPILSDCSPHAEVCVGPAKSRLRTDTSSTIMTDTSSTVHHMHMESALSGWSSATTSMYDFGIDQELRQHSREEGTEIDFADERSPCTATV